MARENHSSFTLSEVIVRVLCAAIVCSHDFL